MSERIEGVLARAGQALRASRSLKRADRERGLHAVAEAVDRARNEVLAANRVDLEAATDLNSALLDRLRLTPERIDGIVEAIRVVASQPDPLAGEQHLGQGPSGIEVFRKRIPLGVVAVVYEARPNVTAECAALTLASGNAIILRGGKEARQSNRSLGAAVRAGLKEAELPEDLVCVLHDADRAEVKALLGAVGKVDLVIPRGGAGLMAMVDEHARVPVIRHGEGVCHIYVDSAADIPMAAAIAENAKVQRPGVCNALETLLVHSSVVEPLLAELGPRLKASGVEIRADALAQAALQNVAVSAHPATEADWSTEFLDLILAVRTVSTLDEALDHIHNYGTHHSAAIVSADEDVAERFLTEVDASCVLWNASTRFNDGGQLGLGAEMGISTSRMHAYGPMAAREMTAEKLVVRGRGEVRS